MALRRRGWRLPGLVLALTGAAAPGGLALPPPPPPLPALPQPEPSAPAPRLRPDPTATRPSPSSAGGPIEASGQRLRINGREQRAAWRWQGPISAAPTQLWLPLEVLQQQLGVSSTSRGPRGDLELEWYGRRWRVPSEQQRSLADEVAVDLLPLLGASGLTPRLAGNVLELVLPPPALLGVRPSSAPPGQRRVVLELAGAAVVRGSESGVEVDLASRADQRASLSALGLGARQQGSSLILSSAGGGALRRVFTLGDPHRLVVDLSGEAPAATAAPTQAPRLDPRLLGRLNRQLRWEQIVRSVAGRPVRLNVVRVDPSGGDLELRPLVRDDGMEGLSSLAGLARRRDALVAINGGFFNRIRRLPLGALREQGRWLSGPILHRGALGWEPRGLPRFGRLRLEEGLRDRAGNRWPLVAVNSGWLQRGLSRYTRDWAASYRSLSEGERAVRLRQGLVQAVLEPEELAAGVPLAEGEMLVVARSGFPLPWGRGAALELESRPSHPLGLASHVLGGGPLLLEGGRPVLDGRAEGFGTAFLSQGAPRTVVASDGRLLWLITLEGVDDEGPTLAETTWLLQQLGLRDALNLDGGSSTGLVMGGVQTVKGRGVAGAVHNGLGLVPVAAGPMAERAGVP